MIGRWLRFVFSLLLPVSGWRDRVGAYRAGQIRWAVPGRPDALPVMPFPVEWTASRVFEPGCGHPRGWEPVSAPCSDCSATVEAPTGVRCARCGVVLHERCAGMVSALDIPACAVCRPLLRIA